MGQRAEQGYHYAGSTFRRVFESHDCVDLAETTKLAITSQWVSHRRFDLRVVLTVGEEGDKEEKKRTETREMRERILEQGASSHLARRILFTDLLKS